MNRTRLYSSNGRFQTELESNRVAKELKALLKEFDINYKTYDGDVENYDKITKEIMQKLTDERSKK